MSAEQPEPASEGNKPKLSKKQLKRQAKQARKKALQEEAAQKRAEAASASSDAEAKQYSHLFGVAPLNRSQSKVRHEYTRVDSMTAALDGKEVRCRARVHSKRGKGGICFLKLRQRVSTVQAVVAKTDTIPKAMVKFVSEISVESLVDVVGVIRVPTEVDNIESCTQQDVELHVKTLFVTSVAEVLPIQVVDCAVPLAVLEAQDEASAALDAEVAALEAKAADLGEDHADYAALQAQVAELRHKKETTAKFARVDQSVRLDNRIIDLRTRANQGIFRIQSAMGGLFREFLLSQDFTEIHSPKMLGAASEGGADVFELKYFDTKAYLAQSPQLFKQMAICGDLERVFEIGPVFRAERSLTRRHLTEFVGLDMEMAFNDHYHEVLEMCDEMFRFIFDNIPVRFALELEAIRAQFPFEPLKYSNPTFRLEWKDAVKLLRDAGVEIGDFEDIDTPTEQLLGDLVREKHGVDFFFLDKFPTSARPFYTMLDPADPNYTNSYDFMLRGQEITSGAQRIHDPTMLAERARAHDIDVATIQAYVDSFKYGAPPHGGCGIGLERITMLYLGLKNIRRSSMFPRDPNRLAP